MKKTTIWTSVCNKEHSLQTVARFLTGLIDLQVVITSYRTQSHTNLCPQLHLQCLGSVAALRLPAPYVPPALGPEQSSWMAQVTNPTALTDYRPAPSSALTDYRPAPSIQITDYRPSSSTELTDYRPSPSSALTDYRPAPATELTDYRPAPSTELTDYRPAPSTELTDYRPAPSSALTVCRLGCNCGLSSGLSYIAPGSRLWEFGADGRENDFPNCCFTWLSLERCRKRYSFVA
jgi:hypothetical protein